MGLNEGSLATNLELALAKRAIRHRLLEMEQVEECVRLQQRYLDEKGKEIPLLKVFVKKGYLTERHVNFLQTGDGVGLELDKKSHRRAIDGYEIEEKIGRGGTSMVYRARRLQDDLICAMKILYPHHTRVQRLVDGFVKEGELVQSLNHENIVAGYDTNQSNNLYYMALEYVEGVSVKSVIDAKGLLSEDLALHIIVQVARALNYMATQGITHRDIKPGNILVDSQGTIKLCDLGFAISADEEQEGWTMGTAQYISPEQVGGQGVCDVRSDIYSLGATLYHMVIGEIPFDNVNLQELIAKGTLEREIKSIKVRNLSPHIHYFLEKMMANDREIRYESADELIEDIEITVLGNKELAFDPRARQAGDPLDEIHELFGNQYESSSSSAAERKTRSSQRVSRRQTRSRIMKRRNSKRRR